MRTKVKDHDLPDGVDGYGATQGRNVIIFVRAGLDDVRRAAVTDEMLCERRFACEPRRPTPRRTGR